MATETTPPNPTATFQRLRPRAVLAGHHTAVASASPGKTDAMIGFWHHVYVHVPIPAVGAREKRLAPEGGVWQAVLEATGQPRRFG